MVTRGMPFGRPDELPTVGAIVFRRSVVENRGLTSDVQHAVTARFWAENNVAVQPAARRVGWWL